MTAKLLSNQLKSIMNDPVEGFTVELVSESSLYEWKVYLEGPKDTPYEGGVFQLLLSFPKDYPMSPPTLRFISEFWHPNIYERDGKVCISILHPPGEDAMSGELPEERWLPTQSVTTIILSLMSILSDPNCSSPANVDASVEWRNNREAYKKRCYRLVEKANKLKPDHIVIPHPDTNPEEHRRCVEKIKQQNAVLDMDYFEYSDDYREDDDDDETETNNDDDDYVDDDENDDDQDEASTTNNKNDSNNNNNNTTTTTTSIVTTPSSSELTTKNNDKDEINSNQKNYDENSAVASISDIVISDSVIPSPPNPVSPISNTTTNTTTTSVSNNNNDLTIENTPSITVTPNENDQSSSNNNNINNNNDNSNNNNIDNNTDNRNGIVIDSIPPQPNDVSRQKKKKLKKKCNIM